MNNQYKIGDIAKVKGGKRLPKGHDFVEDSRIPYLRVVDMINGGIDESDIKYISAQTEQLISNYKIQDKDIYVTIAGTIGNFGVIPSKFNNAQLTENAAKICEIDLNQFNADFLIYKFSSDEIKEQIGKAIGVGGGVPKLALYRIQRINFTAPPFPVQRKIARILSTIDGQIEKTEAIIAKYQAIKQGMLQDLFTRGIDVRTGQLRPRYEDAPALYKESALGMIPREWEVKKLKDVCSRIQDGTHFSPKIDPQGRFLYITSKNIRMGYIDLRNVEYVDAKEHEKIYRRCNTLFGDVLLTKDGANTGNVSLNTISTPISLLSSVAFLRGVPGLLNNNFLLQSLSGERMQTIMKDQMSGNAIPRITLSKINNIVLGVPPIKEQEKIVKSLQANDEILKNEQQTLSKLQLLKQGLMQDLLSGKVEVEA